jgi:hypothetical protein
MYFVVFDMNDAYFHAQVMFENQVTYYTFPDIPSGS